MEPEGSLPHSQEPASCPYPEKYLLKSCQTISPIQRPCEIFRNMVNFCGERLLSPRSTAKLEDHTLSAVRVCLFNILAATLHKWKLFLQTQPEDVSAVVEGTHSSRIMLSKETKWLQSYSHNHLQVRLWNETINPWYFNVLIIDVGFKQGCPLHEKTKTS